MDSKGVASKVLVSRIINEDADSFLREMELGSGLRLSEAIDLENVLASETEYKLGERSFIDDEFQLDDVREFDDERGYGIGAYLDEDGEFGETGENHDAGDDGFIGLSEAYELEEALSLDEMRSLAGMSGFHDDESLLADDDDEDFAYRKSLVADKPNAMALIQELRDYFVSRLKDE